MDSKRSKKNPIEILTMSVKFESFLVNVFRQTLKTTFAGSDDSFRKFIFLLESFLQIIFETTTENCRVFWETVRHARQNCTLHLQKITLKRVFRFWCFVLFIIRRFWTKKFQPFREKFQQGRENCMLRLQKNILRKFFLKRKVCFIIFGPWKENFVPLGEHFSTTLRKLQITCPDETIKFLQITFIITLRDGLREF